MTTNPNPGSDEVREDAATSARPDAKDQPKPAGRKFAYDDQDEDDGRHPAAELLPTPAAPKLSTEYLPDSIVNIIIADTAANYSRVSVSNCKIVCRSVGQLLSQMKLLEKLGVQSSGHRRNRHFVHRIAKKRTLFVPLIKTP